MSVFPETSVTLLRKLAAQVTGEDEDNWVRFANLYVPAIREFARNRCEERNVDDAVQDVLSGLVKALRENKFQPREGIGNFRAYLARMICNRLCSAYRKERTRVLNLNSFADDIDLTVSGESVTTAIDAEWARACHWAAVEHVFTKTLVSDLTKSLYRAFVLEGRPIGEVAKTYGVSRNQVSQAKVRLGRMIEAVMAEFGN